MELLPTLFPLIICILELVSAKVGFVKDQGMDMVFPPNIIRSDSGIPDGHLRPLGWQRRPDGKVAEEKKMLTPGLLHEKYISTEKPVVFRGVLKDDPVLTTWEKDDYLKEIYGTLNVTVTVKKQLLKQGIITMKYKRFLLDYMYEDWYLSSTLPQEMAHELLLPRCLECGSYRKKLQSAELWMSSGGTASLLHSHEDHSLHCVLFGRKDSVVIDRKHRAVFDFKESYPNSKGGLSTLDMDMVNMYKYPKIGKVPWNWSTLRQGDCILIPAGTLHQVRSFGRGISFTIHITPTLEFDDSDCGKTMPQKISDVNFVWTSINGVTQLTNQQLSSADIMFHLLSLMRNGDTVFATQFANFYNDVMEVAPNAYPESKDVFSILDPHRQGYIGRDDLNNIDEDSITQVVDIFNSALKREIVRDEL